jgi:hypothetical protein
MTKEQETALRRVHERHQVEADFETFKTSASPLIGGDGCLLVQVDSGLWLGIETDGYTHS